jgi:geranylgeranyl diphosphate synthase type II
MMNRLAGYPDESAIDSAIAIELLHNFSLIHDDIMDEARIRRNQPTLWLKYGTNNAILAGDMMFALAYDHVHKVPSGSLPAVLGWFNRAAREVCQGQQMDLTFEKRGDVSMNDYLRMVSLKTAAMLGCAAAIGNIVGSGDESQAFVAHDFGLHLGIAFQIKDDILDAYGTQESFGKEIGGDIGRNKKGFLAIHALEYLDERGKSELRQALIAESGPDKVAAVVSLFDRAGARTAAERECGRHFSQAMDDLDKLRGDASARAELQQYCAALLDRQR